MKKIWKNAELEELNIDLTADGNAWGKDCQHGLKKMYCPICGAGGPKSDFLDYSDSDKLS